MKLQKRDFKWLVLLLLPIALIPLAMQWQKQKISDDEASAQQTIPALAVRLERDPSNIVSAHYNINMRKYDYELTYDRQQKTLTQNLYIGGNKVPSRTWRWQKVEESAIHKVAAPTLERFHNPRRTANDAFQSASFDDLKKYGATLAPETNE